MDNKELDIAFKEAVDRVNSYTDPFPADTLLKLYAYYKKATDNFGQPRAKNALVNAFKANALFQAKDLDKKEAKKLYIELVNEYFLYGKK